MPAWETITHPPRRFADPLTGRTWTQLTAGAGWCYPLYFYGPTVTADAGTILFYRYADGSVQNWKLDVASGEATRLTSATTPNCLWRFWDEPEVAVGVRDQMSAFGPVSEEMSYFDGNTLRAVHVRTLDDRVVCELPADRVPCGIPGLSPSGRRFVCVHADRAWWDEATQPGPPKRTEARNVHLDVVDMRTGERRTLLAINAWLTHAYFYDEQRVLFTNLPTEGSLLMTDLRGGWFVALRAQTAEGVTINHALPTRRGIRYETVSPLPNGIMGHCDPDTFTSTDYLTSHPVHHVGQDGEGRLWFGDIYEVDTPHPRRLAWLPEVRPGAVNAFTMLTHGFQMHGSPHAQRSHVHATLLPNRQHILFTGPDDTSQTNHLFLLDVADLAATHTRVETDVAQDAAADGGWG